MKTISDYSIYCTPEQTKKALELGAPLHTYLTKEASKWLVDTAKTENRVDDYERELVKDYHHTIIGNLVYCIPTAEQMLGWIEEQGVKINIEHSDIVEDCLRFHIYEGKNRDLAVKKGYNYSSRKEATLAAIDAALEYLNNKK